MSEGQIIILYLSPFIGALLPIVLNWLWGRDQRQDNAPTDCHGRPLKLDRNGWPVGTETWRD